MSLRLSHVLPALSLAVLVGGIVACSANSSESVFGNGTGGDGTGGSGGDPSDASTTYDGDSGGMIVTDALTGEGSITADSACAAEHAQAEQLPLDLYLMVDRSISMSGSSWTQQSSALNAFFGDPQSDGLYIAMGFFPLNDDCSPIQSNCQGNAYIKPPVDWGLLPGHASALTSAIAQNGPDGCFTPTQEALSGLLEGAKQRQIAEPLHIVAAVIASDGDPCCNDCPCEENTCMGQIAWDYANGSPPIKTFAIAADPAAIGVLTAIAQGGGTTAPFDATGSSQKFIDALNAIRGSMIACEYKVPVPEAGTVNPALVAVQFTPTGAPEPDTIPRKDSAGQCGSDPGWYYDDNTNPTKISFCPATCDAVQNDKDGTLDILLGCSPDQY